jgi:hypothetical protein
MTSTTQIASSNAYRLGIAPHSNANGPGIWEQISSGVAPFGEALSLVGCPFFHLTVDMESKSSYTRQIMGLDTGWGHDNAAIHYGRESSDLVNTSGIPCQRIPPSGLD